MTRREAIAAAIKLNPRAAWFSEREQNHIVTLAGEVIEYAGH